MYILKCSDDTYYTGSTVNLKKRILEHQADLGANYTLKRLPIELHYFEKFTRIDLAFQREKQIQNWSRKKKETLLMKNYEKLHRLAICQNNSHHSFLKNRSPSGAEGKDG
ncbi:GIY-YIG nuclease family protein [Aequorivita sp. KMM 9714]|nr:GIY-YIG nuclease family protein [Aequorivita sp. KMM 9714]